MTQNRQRHKNRAKICDSRASTRGWNEPLDLSAMANTKIEKMKIA